MLKKPLGRHGNFPRSAAPGVDPNVDLIPAGILSMLAVRTTVPPKRSVLACERNQSRIAVLRSGLLSSGIARALLGKRIRL